jgi:hypothetical protein
MSTEALFLITWALLEVMALFGFVAGRWYERRHPR